MYCYPMHRLWLQLFTLLGGIMVPEMLRVSGVEIYTSGKIEAVNGTNVRLKCTFSSTHPVSSKTVTISWNFRPLDEGREESVFYYQEEPFPPSSGRFKDHAVWSGDVSRGDASITLHEVPPTFNGTYTCQVRNLPDVHGTNGEIFLTVVNKAALSEIAVLAAVIGGSCGFILLLVCIVVLVRRSRKRNRHSEEDVELPTRREKEWKDPTVCEPEEAIHLTIVAKALEVDSSDGESEPSSGDDDEEEEDEEDDDDDDDDDGGDDDDD